MHVLLDAVAVRHGVTGNETARLGMGRAGACGCGFIVPPGRCLGSPRRRQSTAELAALASEPRSRR
jgi:hypothetical protein